MSDVVIRVENLGKCYRLQHQAGGQRERYTALRDVIANRTRGLVKKLKPGNLRSRNSLPISAFQPSAISASQNVSVSASQEDFWALKDVSFDIKRGEVVGIIGRNGAGKSTLLKILSRITEPTTGRVGIKGRVASLLEVGTGFHPELTGRENIFLNGAILGMTREEILRKFDEIVAFAEVEKFLDTPVKRYSSGMYVRLAFAVAAHLEPEILIVDEVLAVGDAEFQKKCLGKMQEVSKGGRTVLLVSHNMAAVTSLCSRAIYLFRGCVRDVGTVAAVVDRYLCDAQQTQPGLAGDLSIGTELSLRQIRLNPNPTVSGTPLQIELELYAACLVRLAELALLIYHSSGTRVAVLDFRGSGVPASLEAGTHWLMVGQIRCLPLVEGDYQVGLYVHAGSVAENFLDLTTLHVNPVMKRGSRIAYPAVNRGYVELDFDAVVRMPTLT